MFSTGFTSLSVLLLFPLSITFFVFVHGFFYSISSNIDDVFWINPSANVFVFGDFNVHHKDWLTYSGGSDSSGELCYDFSAANNLTQVVNFPIRIPDCDSHSPALLDFFFFLMLVFVIWLFLHREILLLLSIIFTTGCPISLHSLWLFLC